MKLLVIVLLSALVSFAEGWTEKSGYILEFIWPENSNHLPGFSSRRTLDFIMSYFEDFSRTIGEQLTNLENLNFHWGTVSRIYVNQNWLQLRMAGSKTEMVEIDPDKQYAIVVLQVVECKLTRIPRNIKLLKRLEFLELTNNQIEYVEMSDFNGLKNLNKVYLLETGIKTLSSESTIHLPKLGYLKLNGNNLQELNVCSWDMPSLETFYLHGNKLKFVVNLVDQFPKLKEIMISGNPLVCSWKDNLVSSLIGKNISLLGDAPTCNANDKTPFAKDSSMICSLQNQLSKVLHRQRSFEQSTGNSTESLEQMVKKSNDEIQSLKETVATLTGRLQRMEKKSNEESQSIRHSIDDLTEAFYRYVMEKEGGE